MGCYAVGVVGHWVMDWKDNIIANKRKKQQVKTSGRDTQKTVEEFENPLLDESNNAAKSLIGEPDDDDFIQTNEFNEEDDDDRHRCCKASDSNMISLSSTAGRPQFDELIEKDDTKYKSTGIFLCGPEKMIEGAKKAAGTCGL